MNDRPIRSSVAAIPFPPEDESEAPKQTGADFYLRMLEQMQAADDPRLGMGLAPLPEEEPPADLSAMPLEQKLRDKNAKTKLAGLEQLATEMNTVGEQDLRDLYFSLVMEAMVSPLPNVQKAALELGLRVLQEKNSGAWVDIKELLKGLVEKVLPNMKPQMKKCLFEYFLALLKTLGKDGFIEHLKEPLASKNPKAKAALVKMLTELLSSVGLKDLTAVKLFDAMAKDADNPNPAVKKEFVQFAAEVYRWVGDAFSHKLSAIKKMVADEITKLFDEKKAADGGKPPMPTLEEYKVHYLKKEESGSASKHQGDSGAKDAYDLFDPVDIFKTYGEKWADKVLAQQKWLDKKNLIDEFIDFATKNPKHTGSYMHIIGMVKRLIEDSNINVQSNAVRMLTVISKGLRKELARDGRKIVGLIIPKLKERKKLTDEIIDCLKQTTHYVQPYESVEDYEAQFVPKNNLLKCNTLEWFTWYVENSNAVKNSLFLTSFRPLLLRLSEDGAVEVRDANLGVISKLISSLGQSHEEVVRLLEKLPRAQIEKLQSEKPLEISARTTSSFEPRPGVSNSPKQLARISNLSQPANRKMDIEAPVTKAGKKESSSNIAQAAAIDFRLDLNPDSALAILSNRGIAEEEFTQAQTQAWKTKVDFMAKLTQTVGSDASESEYEAASVLMAVLLKQFKETNPNLLKEYVSFLEIAVQTNVDQLNARFVYGVAWFLVEKYADPKFFDKQKQIITGLSEKNKVKLVLALCDLIASKNPAAKSHSQLLALIADLVSKDSKTMPRKEILTLAKEGSANANAQVKEEVVNLFCVLYKHYGDSIRKTVADVSGPLRKQIESKLEKIQPVMPEVDENAPRKEVSQQIAKLGSQLHDQKWTTRKDALIEASKIIKMAGRISSKGMTDFGTVLKERLVDSNQVVAREALQVLKVYIKALGAEFKGQSRLLLPLIVNGLNDKLDAVRDLVKEIFDLSQVSIGSEWVLNLLVGYLGDSSSELVLKVLEYLNIESQSQKLCKGDLKLLAKQLVSNLIHKNSSVRLLAERLLEKIHKAMSRDSWMEACRDMNPTSRQQVESILAKMFPQSMDIEKVPANTIHQSELHHNVNRKKEGEFFMPHQQSAVTAIEKSMIKVKTMMGSTLLEPSQPVFKGLPLSSYGSESSDLYCVRVTYSGPRDEEIVDIRRKLTHCFDEGTAEKLFSNEQAKLFDSLGTLGLLRMTQTDRYYQLLSLILNWMYVRVFDTNRKYILDLLAEFLMTNMEDFASRRIAVTLDIQSKVLHVLAKILDHHPDREQSLRFINKFCLEVSRSGYLQEFYALLLDSLASTDIDPQITSILLTQLLDFIDLRKALSLRNLGYLERYTCSLPDLAKSEIYHFYAKCMNFLGSKFFDVFQFVDKSPLTRYFASANPETEVPTQTAMALWLRRLQSGERDDRLRAMQDLAKSIDSGTEAALKEIKLNSSVLVIAVIKLHEALLSDLRDQEFIDALCIFRQKLFSCRKFTLSLTCSSLQELLDLLLGSLITVYRESKTASGDQAAFFQRVIANTNIAVLSLIVSVHKTVGPPTLLDMLAANYREMQRELAADTTKTRQTIIINCILNVAKKFTVASDEDEQGVAAILAKVDGFLSDFAEGEKSAAHRAVRTVVSKLCELMGDNIWRPFQASRNLRPSVQAADSQILSNLIKVALMNQQTAMQTEESLFRRRKDNLEDKENKELRDLEIERLAKEAGNLSGREESSGNPVTLN